MTTFCRQGHWRTNAYGTQYPVRRHVVTRDHWTRSSSSAAHDATRADGRVWWSRERPLPSFTRPNARCPVCGETVFFYQSPYGGRVFFDELGPTWPKHPCTDSGAQPVAAPFHTEQRAAWRRDWRLLTNLRLCLATSSAQPVGHTEDGSRVRLEIDAAALGSISRFAYLQVDNGASPTLATIDPVTAEPIEFKVKRAARATPGPIAERHRQLFEADYRRLPRSFRRRLGLPALTKLLPDVMSLWKYRSESRIAFFIPAYLEDRSIGDAPARVVTRVVRLLSRACRIARREAPSLEARAYVLIRDHFGDSLRPAIDRAYHRRRLGPRLPTTFIDVTAGSAVVVVSDRFEYKIFTRAFDEEVAARGLVDDAALASLEAVLIDAASRSRIPADLDRLVPNLAPGSLTGCAVSFLVDNSGSMRGAKDQGCRDRHASGGRNARGGECIRRSVGLYHQVAEGRTSPRSLAPLR